ncbi:hypothetical protein EYR36_006210 [Pleurotus pulmonarius]|nr:hypothetical protein EYR36_006210 [Pleurotus pulmonarius]KAF4600916.1 hypothetical protein EYR38_005562 [Pleurotus pulmonarius]
MGERHQIWLIAKVVPRDSTDNRAYYRSLGGFHNQSCYGRLPPRAVRRFIDLAKQKDNAEIIQIELDSVQKKYSRDADEEEMPAAPCPYTLHLLGLSCCVDLDSTPTHVSGPTYDGYVVPATMRGSFDYGPDDGISVIDVTDPMNPAYCHILSHRPLSAGEYIGRYYGSLRQGATQEEQAMYTELKAHIETIIASLDDVGLVTTEMLAEAWPGEYASHNKASETSDEVVAPLEQPPVSEDNDLPPLADLVVGPAVRQSIAQGNFDGLEQLVWIPGKAKLIKAALQEINPFPDTAIPLLRRVCEVELQTSKNELDLSGLPLSSDQILDFVSQSGGVQRLRLLNMPHVTIDTVRSLLSSVPPITHLNLLGTPITNESIFELLSKEPKLFYHVEALVHPALLRHDAVASYKAAFTFPGVLCPLVGGGGCPAVPFFTPQKIVQMFLDFSTGMFRKGRAIPGTGFYVGLRGSTMLATACLAFDRVPDQKFSESRVPIFPLFCKGYLDGEGWALLLSETGYSFCRLLKGEAEAEDMELWDLDGFLVAMEAEGRPAPQSASVSELKGLIAEVGLKVMDRKEAGYSLGTLKRDVSSYNSI